MTWHLKDRELEKKLIAIDPDFIENLQKKEVVGTKAYSIHFGDYVLSGSIGSPRFYAYFDKSELEDVPKYNPNAWNEYPEVTPPYDVMMRIKMKNGYLRAGYLKKFTDGDIWVNPNGVLMCNAENAEIEFFRPWED